ncbi:DNA-binding domain-containing protein, partial [Bartonella acomydis]|uniref:DNA-binding domain-containing protein n=1 Tax=Bartonella acomydis TaxID=686234 RepID=UPI0031ED1398
MARYEGLSKVHKSRCEQRLKALCFWEDLLHAGMGVHDAASLCAVQFGVSRMSLFNWCQMVEGAPRCDWLAALAPCYGEETVSQFAPCHEEAFEVLCSDYLRPSRPAFSACYRRMVGVAREKGWVPIPSERALRRRFKAQVSKAVVALAREGEEKANMQKVALTAGGMLTTGEESTVLGHDVLLSADRLSQAGTVEAQGGALSLNSSGLVSNQGIMVGVVVDAKLGSLVNSGQFLSQGAFTLVAANHDPLLGQTALVLNAEGGVLKSGGAFVLTTDALNNAGILGSGGDGVALNVSGDLSNSGLIYAKKSAMLSLDGDFINQFGDVIAEDNLIIHGLKEERAGHVINSSGLLEAVSGDMRFDVSALTNMREGGVEVSDKVV